MDILYLVDRLEELFNTSRPIPLTHNVIVDEDRMLDLIDQMRVTIPEEVKKSQDVLARRDRILAQAQEEANRTLAIAREKSKQLTEQNSVVIAAKARAEEIKQQAQAEAEETRREADKYVIQTLSRLEMELERPLNQIRNGIIALQEQTEQESGDDLIPPSSEETAPPKPKKEEG
jgi:cell division septum initiation protein DivIVA